MIARAFSRNLRVSPDKMRLVISEIKKLHPNDAVKILDFVPKKSSKMVKKTIQSAIANAKNNFGLEEGSLKFKEISVGKGLVFTRVRPIARGRRHLILKRSSNLKVILEGEQPKKEVSKAKEEPKVSNEGEEKETKEKDKDEK